MAKVKKEKPSDLTSLIAEYGSGDHAQKTVVSTGSLILDKLLGGGYSLGTVVEIGGPPGVGKSTLVLATLKHLCDQGHKCAYVDFEGGVNKSQLEGIGLSKYWQEKFFLFQKGLKTFKDAEKVLDTLFDDGSFSAIVIDSDTAIVPSEMFEKSIEDIRPGVHAQLIANLLNKYTKRTNETETVIILVSQVRTRFNFKGISTVEVAGGNAKKHFCDIRLQMRPTAKITRKLSVLGESKEVQIGSDVEVWASKNRLAPPFIKAPIRIIFGRGYHNAASLFVWLTSHTNPDGSPFLLKYGNGRYSAKIGDLEEKIGYEADVDQWITANVPMILDLIETRGGFELIESEEEFSPEEVFGSGTLPNDDLDEIF